MIIKVKTLVFCENFISTETLLFSPVLCADNINFGKGNCVTTFWERAIHSDISNHSVLCLFVNILMLDCLPGRIFNLILPAVFHFFYFSIIKPFIVILIT